MLSMEHKSNTSLHTKWRNGSLDFSKPLIMGIVNVTPDSFYDGGKHQSTTSSVQHALHLMAEGADIIDIGGQSTRPNSDLISPQEELDRIATTIQAVRNYDANIAISVDTFYASVAKHAIELGANIINDVSAGNMDADMITTVAKSKSAYIAMHMQGTPQTMQLNPQYKNVVQEVLVFFENKIAECKAAGIEELAIDPGFGFGKTREHNYSLLSSLQHFQSLGVPVLAGLSRKSMLYKPLNLTAEDALNATTAANAIALMKGANILRVHDVAAAVQAVKIFTLTQNSTIL
jgi:dihydropteroate synthase